ncbi:950_t:CDS:2, partial [Racocetra fulgida]
DPKLSTSLYTKPTDTQIAVNIPYEDLIQPVVGPNNPFSTRVINQNVLTGHVEEQAYSEFAFRTQQRTFTSFGYAADPSLVNTSSGGAVNTGFVGDVEKAMAMNGATIYDSTPKVENTPKRKPKGDSAILEGEDSYQGPWAGYEGENIGTAVGPPEGAIPKKADTDVSSKKQIEVGQEKTTFHGMFIIWDVYNDRRCLRTYMGHNKAVRDITFSNDGKRFLTASYDKYIKLWDTETGAVNTITFVDENRRFVTTSDDKTLRAWEFDIPVVIKYIAEPHMHSMPAVTLHPNTCQSLDNQIVVYGAKDRFRMHRKKRFTGHLVAGYACQVNFSPDGRFIMSGDSEGNIWYW